MMSVIGPPLKSETIESQSHKATCSRSCRRRNEEQDLKLGRSGLQMLVLVVTCWRDPRESTMVRKGTRMACPWAAVDSAKLSRTRERRSVLSCGNTSGVSTYSLITGPSEVQSADDIIHPLWPSG